MSRFRVKLNYTPALLYPYACVARVRIRTRSHARIRITVAVANEHGGVVYTGEYPGMCSLVGGPLLEKIRLDNATIQWHNRKVEAVVGLNKNKRCGSMTRKDGIGWLEKFGNGLDINGRLIYLLAWYICVRTYIRMYTWDFSKRISYPLFFVKRSNLPYNRCNVEKKTQLFNCRDMKKKLHTYAEISSELEMNTYSGVRRICLSQRSRATNLSF